MDCLTPQQLQRLAAGEEHAAWTEHVQACAACRRRWRELQAGHGPTADTQTEVGQTARMGAAEREEVMERLFEEGCTTVMVDGDLTRSQDSLETGWSATVSGGEGMAKYQVKDVLARGGMGVVRVGQDRRLRRLVAMKAALHREERKDADVLRFVEEAQVMGQLEHPNIVPVHELGADDEGNPYYTMKLIRGTTLRDIVKRLDAGDAEALAEYPLNALLNIFLKICDAVAFAHSRGVVHRDLKPHNVMIGQYGEVLVVDWGLAKIIDRPAPPTDDAEPADGVRSDRGDEAAHRTIPGAVLGTPTYMAPEQAYGDAEAIDGRSDIYALGGILYHLLSLRTAVTGKHQAEVLFKLTSGELTPLAAWEPDGPAPPPGQERPALRHLPGGRIPDSLAAVVDKAMALDPAARYQQVQELQQEIEKFQAGFATEAEQADLWRQLRLLVQRHRRQFATAAAAVLLVLVLVAVAMVKINAEKNQAQQARRAEERQRRQAEAARSEAVEQRNAAQQARTAAEKARTAAEKARLQAEISRDEALLAKAAEEKAREETEDALQDRKSTRLNSSHYS